MRGNPRSVVACLVRGVLLAISCSIVLAGCGDDRPTRAAFVRHMASVSATPDARSPQWRAIWGCVYDKASSDDTVVGMMALQPGDNPSSDVSKLVVQCASAKSTGATTRTSSPQ